MASMLRTKKGKKIAYAILGTPPNMIKQKRFRPKKQIVQDPLPT